MDTNELMNTETMETAADALSTVGTAIANTATGIAQNIEPEIRYIEVPVEGSANVGAFVVGALTSAIVTIGGVVGVKIWKKRKAKKQTKETASGNAEDLSGYERTPEPEVKEEQKTEGKAESKPAEKVEPVSGTVEPAPTKK